MKFCSYCGSQLADGAKFCTECGAKAEVSAPEPAYEPPVQQTYEPPVQQAYEPPVQQAYEPPVQQAYEPPVQQAYEPPVQQTYEPPVQRAYEPPVQQAYEPPVQRAERPSAVRNSSPAPSEAKSSGDKRLLPILIVTVALVVILAVLLVVVLVGGKNQGTEADLGLYQGVSCIVSGTDVGAEGEWIRLQEKRNVTMFLLDKEYSGKWKLDGEDLVIRYGGEKYFGTLKQGVLEVEISGMRYTFQKNGGAAQPGAAPGATLLPTEPEPEAAEGPVTYKLVKAYDNGEEMTPELLEMLGGGYVIFNGDGTGLFSFFGDTTAITYDDTNMMAGEDKIPYTLTENGMEFVMDEASRFILEVTDETPELPPPASGEEEPDEPEEPVEADELQAWAGDYYGFWIIDSVWSGTQEWVQEGAWWDTCASLEWNGDGTGTLILWDVDFTKDDPLAELSITASAYDGVARFCGEEGQFLGEPLEHADWLWYSDETEYEDLLLISGQFDNGEDDFWYDIYLRPWGMEWSDIQEADPDLLPGYYEDWYLPLVESGVTEAPAGYVGE